MLHLHLEALKHFSVSLPLLQAFPRRAERSPEEQRFLTLPPGSPPPGGLPASEPGLSTPAPFLRPAEGPATPGPTRTAAAWSAKRRSSATSSNWRGRRASRWERRRSTEEEVYPEIKRHLTLTYNLASHLHGSFSKYSNKSNYFNPIMNEKWNLFISWPDVCCQVHLTHLLCPAESVQSKVEGGSLCSQLLHDHWLHCNTLNSHVFVGRYGKIKKHYT